mmetsp:Transcript_40584/g.96416  ORF Transcript_40584/g.96416 Transcript_40584/m.96416 type:complete len:193 (+) Transcript_40584:722-1300(+)
MGRKGGAATFEVVADHPGRLSTPPVGDFRGRATPTTSVIMQDPFTKKQRTHGGLGLGDQRSICTGMQPATGGEEELGRPRNTARASPTQSQNGRMSSSSGKETWPLSLTSSPVGERLARLRLRQSTFGRRATPTRFTAVRGDRAQGMESADAAAAHRQPSTLPRQAESRRSTSAASPEAARAEPSARDRVSE